LPIQLKIRNNKKYIFYIVIGTQSWTHKKFYPLFPMNMLEGALKDAIKNSCQLSNKEYQRY